MRRAPLALLVVLLLALVGDHVIFAQNPPCNPDRDRRNPNLQAAKEAKKAQLRRRGYPERFMKLIDQEECIACVREASDAFHIMIVYKDNDYAPVDAKTGNHWSHVSTNWSPALELQAREKTKDGTIKGYYISNTLKRDCQCCPDDGKQGPEDYSDWNDDLGVNMNHVIPFDSSNTNGPPPDDLVNPNDRWVGEPPPEIHVFTKPPKKQAHALCPACQADIDKLNAAHDALDALYSEKIATLEARQRNEQQAAKNDNEIRLLWYRQRSQQLASDANAKRIDELEAANEKLKSEMRAQWQQVEAIDDKIVAQRASLAALETATAAECERKCKVPTTAITETPPPAVPPASTVGPPPAPPPVVIEPPKLPPAEVFKPNDRQPPPPSAPPSRPPFDVAYPLPPISPCPQCQAAYDELRSARERFRLAFNDPYAGLSPTSPGAQAASAYFGAEARLRECALACLTGDGPKSSNPPASTPPSAPTVAPPPPPSAPPSRPPFDVAYPLPPMSPCPQCQAAYDELRKARERFRLAYNDPYAPVGPTSTAAQPASAYFGAEARLRECALSCLTANGPSPAPPPLPPVDTCFGDACMPVFGSCTEADTCGPPETDCRFYGECTDNRAATDGGLPMVNVFNDFNVWLSTANLEYEPRVQDKLTDMIGISIVIQPVAAQGVMQWFNPLGLLAKRLADHVDRWRGSMAPRRLIQPRDLELIDRVSNVQAAGLPKGVHVLLTDQGGSTGKTLVMNVLNLSGRPVRLSNRPFAVQPIKQQAQQQAMQAFSRLAKAAPTRLDLNAYCVEFLKLPPGPSTLLRLAPANVQQKYASMSKVLQSAYRVSKGNALHPDSNPAAYTDAMKQWALWTVEQNFNEARFTEAFLGHTKKNVEAAKQQWSKQAEDMIRQAAPNRWRDIARILQGAGVPVPK